MNPVSLKDILKLLVVWVKSRFTKEGRKAARRAMLHNKVHGVTNTHEVNLTLLKPQIGTKKSTAWPAAIDDLFWLGIRAVEMSDGRRWEFRCTWEYQNELNKKCEPDQAAFKTITSYKWVSATHKKTSEPKTTVTPAPKTQRVMNPQTGEFEDVAI